MAEASIKVDVRGWKEVQRLCKDGMRALHKARETIRRYQYLVLTQLVVNLVLWWVIMCLTTGCINDGFYPR